jgi:uncharacterized membrane protein
MLTIARPPAAEGLAWIKSGWNWFKSAPVPWMGMTALIFLVLLGIGMLPYAGKIAIQLLSPFLVAGYMSASRAADTGQPVSFLHLGAGFAPNSRINLLVMGAVYLVGMLFIDLIMQQMAGDDFIHMTQTVGKPSDLTPEQAQAALNQALPALLVGLLLLTPLIMATWFAPALTLFEGFSVGNALWWSLWACAKNWRPLTLYSLILGLMGVVALLIPFGLGLLVFLPITLASTYAAYQAIFVPAASA